ncbi:MAG TPA: DUF167 domain-containing protein [Blastocatellia bacterium]|nr:DUF167 domain-containing protein [Blastocatellia bacterium]
MIKLATKDGVVTFNVRVQPRASKNGVVGELDGVLKIRLAAPPVEGQANEELIRLLAELFDAPRRRIAILSGQTSKNKVVGVSGISIDEASRILAEVLDRLRAL